jgi:plasmid stabilization system protein ParE
LARVVVTPTAVRDLQRLIRTHSLPPDTTERVRHSLAPLLEFPRLGAVLQGRWAGYRFLLGPWRWMIIVYVYDEAADRVSVVTVQDARSSRLAVSRES